MIHTVRIEKNIHGGKGLARLDSGMVVLVPFVLPGEEVEVRETVRRRGYMEAEPVRIIRPSPDRVAPPCTYYGKCGGCNLQHCSWEAQHRIKEEIVRESLFRAGIKVGTSTFRPIIPSPEPLHYRYRIRLKVSPEGALGFHEAASNRVVDIASCRVATGSLNDSLAELRQSSLLGAVAHSVEEIEMLQSPADGRIIALLHVDSHSFSLSDILAQEPPLKTINGVLIKGSRKSASAWDDLRSKLVQDFDQTICGRPYSLSWSPGCFSQVNAGLNPGLVKAACQVAGDVRGKHLVELFCGMGNFSIPLGLLGAELTGVERDTECIEEARRNCSLCNVADSSFIDQDVHKWLRKAAKQRRQYDIALLDPPRQGMGTDIALLAELSPARIIYISCDPATLARDIALLGNQGYTLSSLTPVDMFPQTHHIESVALLEKN